MVTVFNSRVAAAGRNAKYAVLIAALSLLLVGALLSWSNRYAVPHPEFDACGGYGGQPSYEYINRTGDRAAALAHCLKDRPLLSISVKNRHYIAIQKKRLEALDTGVLLTSDADFVPARVRFKGNDYKAKIRLKGDWTDHVLDPTRWSFRIVLSGDGYILGRKRFSLQTFKVRNNDKDPLYALHLAAVGQITPGYKPVRVEFNGEEWGTMVIEDHFNRELMEARGRKESVIGRFDESAMWRHRFRYPEFDPYDNVYTTAYKSFNTRVINKSPALQVHDSYSKSVMAAWQEGRIALADIIDLEKFADFIVASEAWSGAHTFRWHNMRFYLNPYTIKFEPVPFDNGWFLWDISTPPARTSLGGSHVLAELLYSRKFRDVLDSRLQPVLLALQERTVWADLRKNATYLASLLSEEGASPVIGLGLLKKNLEYLQSSGGDYFDTVVDVPLSPALSPTPSLAPETSMQRKFHTHVKVSAYSNGLISLANKLSVPVEVGKVRLVTGFDRRWILAEGAEPIELPATPLSQRPDTVELQAGAIEPGSKVVVSSTDPATGSQVEDSTGEVLDFITTADLKLWSPLELPGTSELPDYIVVNEGQWLVPKGHWIMQQPLVVPEGVVLGIQPGAHIKVGDGAFILCRGALDMLGSAEDPVVIEGVEGGPWNGIYLLQAEGNSTWRNVIIRDPGSFSFDHFSLTGAINFYRSDVRLEHVTVGNVSAEDAINAVESRFRFEKLSITRTDSDALDSDFSSGVISASEFIDIGGDAIDTSGSNVVMRNIRISAVADKAISIGEASRAEIYDAQISDVGVGIAVKDYSRARLKKLDVRGARVAAAMAYSKKREYGGALLEITDFKTQESGRNMVSQFGSTLTIEGATVPPRKLNIDYYYQQGLMPK